MDLNALGWNAHFSREFGGFANRGLLPARVSSDQRHLYTIICEHGELIAEVSGKFRLEAARADFPVVGDWVAVAPRYEEGAATIHAVLPRASLISRRSPGEKTEQQVVAANVDTVVIVSGLDHDFNIRRLERYLILAWNSGAIPVIVLNKADICEEPAERQAEVEAIAPGVAVIATSATRRDGLAGLHSRLAPGKTAVFLGSSGAGKSTLINALLGEERQETGAVREDDSRGRHTTSRRELVLLPGGAILVDNPGMREVGLWGGEEDVAGSFSDVESLAAGCRFSDCRHLREPGCAVRQALRDGTLHEDRFRGYLKLRRELAYVEAQQNERLRQERKQRWRQIGKLQKSFRKDRR
jgi:ribosome biogenesis GTPase